MFVTEERKKARGRPGFFRGEKAATQSAAERGTGKPQKKRKGRASSFPNPYSHRNRMKDPE